MINLTLDHLVSFKDFVVDRGRLSAERSTTPFALKGTEPHGSGKVNLRR
jgi:hypothetical protein